MMKPKATDSKFPYLTVLLSLLPLWLSIWGALRSAAKEEPDYLYIAAQIVGAGMFSIVVLLTLAAWANKLTDEVKELKSMIWELEGKVSRLKAAQVQADKPTP